MKKSKYVLGEKIKHSIFSKTGKIMQIAYPVSYGTECHYLISWDTWFFKKQWVSEWKIMKLSELSTN